MKTWQRAATQDDAVAIGPEGHTSSDLDAPLGDFIISSRLIFISLLAIGIGVLSAFVAVALLKLIGLFTNLFFFQRWDMTLVSPAGNQLGGWVVLVPMLGGLLVGLMARFGSERIRGHGIPEAIEAILMNGSRVEPKVALLKPISAAVSIGSGGPFGAEGPIIMTGGAVGSLTAQFFHLTSNERKTLLVAGAAGGMAATFAAPVAAILLAVELLLFEWKPRSVIPVALASAMATLMRRYLLGVGPIFPVPPHLAAVGPAVLLSCVVVGLLAGGLSALLTVLVYAFEDAFQRLPIHWMWWPILGGLAIGIGGLILPQALGVGYDTIGGLLAGTVTGRILLGIVIVKSLIWAISLGSGTSGGVLAPLLMIGGALGGLEALILPNQGAGFWPLISMGAILGGTMRSPFTGIIFALELTHDINAMLPLTVAVFLAHGFTVLTLRRSILTEKISRRGYHLSREYAVDPLEILFVREAMRTNVVAFSASATPSDFARSLRTAKQETHERRGQHLYPVVNEQGAIQGVLTRRDLGALQPDAGTFDPHAAPATLLTHSLLRADPVVAYPDEPMRVVVNRMAETGLTQFPVVERGEHRRLLGLISLRDLLLARERNWIEERDRERVFRVRLFAPARAKQPQDVVSR